MLKDSQTQDFGCTAGKLFEFVDARTLRLIPALATSDADLWGFEDISTSTRPSEYE